MVCRYQHSTLQLLPAGATVAGWVIFLPLDQRALFTAHEIFGLKLRFDSGLVYDRPYFLDPFVSKLIEHVFGKRIIPRDKLFICAKLVPNV